MPNDIATIDLKIGQNDVYDQRLEQARRDGLPDHGDFEIVTKTNATRQGRSLAMITFTVQDGAKRKRVQCVTSVKLLSSLLDVMREINKNEDALQ